MVLNGYDIRKAKIVQGSKKVFYNARNKHNTVAGE